MKDISYLSHLCEHGEKEAFNAASNVAKSEKCFGSLDIGSHLTLNIRHVI